MQEYIIKPNDTMFLIAEKFRIPLVQLIRANPQITNPEVLAVGQTIIIPDLLPVPKPLEVLEMASVDIIEDIYISDWENVNVTLNELKMAMSDLVPYLHEALVPNEIVTGLNQTISALEQNVRQKKAYSAISQANQITQYIADILDYYATIIPTDIYRLIYLGRQMIINVEQNDWAEARANYERIKTVWEGLKSEIRSDYSQEVIVFEQILRNLMESINRRDYQRTIMYVEEMLKEAGGLASDFQ